jgi:hypothetical protein
VQTEVAALASVSEPFDGLRACKPTVIADGHDRANCGTQVLIAAITVSAIRDVSENPWRGSRVMDVDGLTR